MTHDISDAQMGWLKVTIAWLAVFLASVTLQQIAFVLTIVFTALQIYSQIRKMRRELRMEKLEAVLKHQDAFSDTHLDVE